MTLPGASRATSRQKDRPAQTHRFIAKREAILDAAARQFNKHGLKGATLADVAGSVDLLTNSVTYYYRRKEDLVAACLLRAIEAMQGVAVAALAESSPEARIRALICGQAALLADIAAGRRDDLVNFNDIRTLRSPLVDDVFAAYTEMYRSFRRLLPKEGSCRQARNARAHLLLSLVNWMRKWIGRFEPDDYRHAANRMGDIVIGGLARERGQWVERPAPELGWPQPATGERAIPDAFLRAATALVNEQGYRGASVERIAARLNLTKGSFYHHYSSKDELVGACFERTFDVIRHTQMLAMERMNSGWERLSATARVLVRFQISEQGPLVRTTAWNALPHAERADSQRRFDRLTEKFDIFIVEGMLEGTIPPLDPGIAAQQVAGMINAASELERWAPGIAHEDAVRLYARPLFEGILSPGADGPSRGDGLDGQGA
jgi:AcrR family transcriptional regulator